MSFSSLIIDQSLPVPGEAVSPNLLNLPCNNITYSNLISKAKINKYPYHFHAKSKIILKVNQKFV